MKTTALLLVVLASGCSMMGSQSPTATGESGPPPGISFRVQNNDASKAYADAIKYCKSHGSNTATMDKMSKQDPSGEAVAQFSCR